MNEIEELIRRQAARQKQLAGLSWPEKIRMAETVRPFVLHMAEFRRRVPRGGSTSTQVPPESKPPRSVDPEGGA